VCIVHKTLDFKVKFEKGDILALGAGLVISRKNLQK
jgi:hypothetical protein